MILRLTANTFIIIVMSLIFIDLIRNLIRYLLSIIQNGYYQCIIEFHFMTGQFIFNSAFFLYLPVEIHLFQYLQKLCLKKIEYLL